MLHKYTWYRMIQITMKFHSSDVQLSSTGGGYFQILFSESKQEDHVYVLLQNSFEFPAGQPILNVTTLAWLAKDVLSGVNSDQPPWKSM